MANSIKRGIRLKSRKVLVVAIAFLVIILALGWLWFSRGSGTGSDYHETLSYTESDTIDGSGCTHITYHETKYCMSDSGQIYDTMDEQSKKLYETLGASVHIVRVEFTADFHIGTHAFVGDTEVPTLFIDKVYSATATEL